MKCALEKKKNPKIYSGQTTMCGKPEHRRFYLYLARTRRRSPSRGSSPHKTAQKKVGFVYSPCICLTMSESPGSVIDRQLTLKYLPQAVPKSMLVPE